MLQCLLFSSISGVFLILLKLIITNSIVFGQDLQSAFINNSAELSFLQLQNAQFSNRDRFQFSFRTCSAGELFRLESDDQSNVLALEIFLNGSLNLMISTADVIDHIPLSDDLIVNNNQWYSIDKEFRTGRLTLRVEQGPNILQQVLISNNTLRSHLWDVEYSSVTLGRRFTGCVQQGIGLDFNEGQWSTRGTVLWNACPLESSDFAGCGKTSP